MTIRPPFGPGRCAALVSTLVLLSCVAVASASPALPRGDLRYRCRLSATRAGAEISIVLRLRTNGSRQAWRVRLFHEEARVFSRVRRTNALGNLKVVRVVPNTAGRDDIAVRARHLRSAAVCRVDSRI